MRFSDLGNGQFKNPILFADYSDPDVIRVGDTYYLTASSFNYTPGLPILISKDLVNWELKNYALKNIKEQRFDIPRHSEGVWAPSIRFHEGMFYIYYGMPDEGIYVVRTTDPLGDWEEPVRVLEAKGFIDPCPIWDEDGRTYIIHGYAKSRIGFKSILGIFEISPDSLKAISEDQFIFDGNDERHLAITIEGPKVYKRDGFYYILAPAGGVKEGYQVALRSKDIYGPYELKTVCESGDSVINGPHQGGLVDTKSGQEWFIHFQDRGLYGRICHMQRVTWDRGWPVIGVNPDDNGIGHPSEIYDKPDVEGDFEKTALFASDEFEGGKYNLNWQWLGNHKESFYSAVTGRDNGIRLYCLNPSGDEEPTLWRSSNVLTLKLVYPVFETIIKCDMSGLCIGERAGVCMTGGQYIMVYLEKEQDARVFLKVAESYGEDKQRKEDIIYTLDVTDKDLSDISCKLIFDIEGRNFDSELLYYKNIWPLEGEKNPSLKVRVTFGDGEEVVLPVDYTPSDHTWVGAKIGIFALATSTDPDYKGGHGDFLSVTTTEL
ncbi:glycoside hydrolase 43 family protein [Butyrivibrio proteoclasticus]|uniref:glycoside hydrolase family 43 protein n=1 Tax=Butyrivibrio proteoclasticus TaxID=43305 RepID=UPI00054D507D|nr:glycoside hydrolase 43 family protein [Butyrivibrio proteoclasticus]